MQCYGTRDRNHCPKRSFVPYGKITHTPHVDFASDSSFAAPNNIKPFVRVTSVYAVHINNGPSLTAKFRSFAKVTVVLPRNSRNIRWGNDDQSEEKIPVRHLNTSIFFSTFILSKPSFSLLHWGC